MGNLPSNKVEQKTAQQELDISSSQNDSNFIWLIATQPKKTFSIDDIIDAIMNSGVMIHEKEFVNMMAHNSCRKTSVPFLKKKTEQNFGYKNKYMNNDFDYL